MVRIINLPQFEMLLKDHLRYRGLKKNNEYNIVTGTCTLINS